MSTFRDTVVETTRRLSWDAYWEAWCPPMVQVPGQRRDDGSKSPTVLLPVLAYAERYPRVPIFTIVECLLDTWRDASLTYVDDDWMASFDSLASARLAELSRGVSMSSQPRSQRRYGRGP